MRPESGLSPAVGAGIELDASLPDPATLRSRVLAAFRGELRRDPPPWSYRIGIVFVAAVMLLLPLIYLAIPVLVAWFAQWNAVHNVGMLENLRGSTQTTLVLGAYLAPMIVATLLVFMLVKPFFARGVSGPEPITVTADDQPVLWAFAEKIRVLVGAPPIRQLVIDHDVNASASLGAGIWSVFNRKLVLTVGLPLLSGLTTRQLAGVLAHEFGHFSQGGAMRLTHLVRTINFWFLRVVYGRDAWDDGLRRAAKATDLRLSWVIWITIGSVWLTRRILWALMHLGQATSGFLMRAMEFDADSREIHLVGSPTFETTTERMRDLALTGSAAHQRLALYSRNGKLVDDLGTLVTLVEQGLDANERRALLDLHAARKSSVYDTHPPDEQRVARARQAADAGIFDLEEPAQRLVVGYPELARRVTEWFYVNVAGIAPDASFVLRPAAEVIESSEREIRGFAALTRGFQGSFDSAAVRPSDDSLVRLFAAEEAEPDGGFAPAMRAMHERVVAARPTARAAAERADVARRELLRVQQAETFAQCGVDLRQITSLSDLHSATALSGIREREQNALREARRDYVAAADPMFERIALARRALDQDPPEFASASLATSREDMDRLAVAIDALSGSLGHIDSLERELAGSSIHAQLLRQVQDNDRIRDAIDERRRVVREQIDAFAAGLGGVPYPLEHATSGLDCAAALIPNADPAHGEFAIFVRAETVVSRYRETVARCLGALCGAVEEVEREHGIGLLSSNSEDKESG